MGKPWLDEVRDWMGTNVMSCLAAAQFLTVVPPLVRRPFTNVELGRAVGYFPLIGVLIGLFLVALDKLFLLFLPLNVTAVLVLTGWTLCTGALHWDGFLDSCDGLFAGRTPEERLRILRDEHVGAFAVVGGLLLLLVKFQGLTALQNRSAALCLTPVLGRWGMTVAVVMFPYARTEGLGRVLKDHAGWGQMLWASVIAAVIAWFAASWLGWILLLLCGVLILFIAWFVLARLPGFTGDIYGALCELLETLVLLGFIVGQRR